MFEIEGMFDSHIVRMYSVYKRIITVWNDRHFFHWNYIIIAESETFLYHVKMN